MFTDFSELSNMLSQKVADTLFVDQVLYNFEEKIAILQLIREHITDNVIKVN